MMTFDRRLIYSKSGTSLIEILVAVFVLMVGILIIIQMFPTGFQIVQSAESRTIATSLARQELERWKNMSASLPDGIIISRRQSPSETTSIYADEPAPPFSMFRDITGDGIVDENDKLDGVWVRGNVLNMRRIVNETTSIPSPTKSQTQGGAIYGSVYTLAFSPIDAYVTGTRLEGISIKSGELSRRVGDVLEAPPSLKQGQYAVSYRVFVENLDTGSGPADYYVFHAAFPQGAGGQEYYMSFQAIINTTYESVIDGLLIVDSQDEMGWQPVIIGSVDEIGASAQVSVENYSDSCARGYRALPVSATWSPDNPYEFKLVDQYMGVIAFNPKGNSLYEYTEQGVKPISARITYDLYDPRIMHEDLVIPAKVVVEPETGRNSHPLTLSLGFILDAGLPDNYTDGTPTDNIDEPSFEGLMRAYETGGVLRPMLGVELSDADASLLYPYSVLVVDLDTGLRIDTDPTRGINERVIVDYEEGLLNMPLNADLVDSVGNVVFPDMSLAGRKVRVFYRTDGDWTMQCQKAFAEYNPIQTGYPDYRSFVLANHPDGTPRRILFARSEIGKSVVVDYTYGPSDNTRRYREAGETFQVTFDAFNSGFEEYGIIDIPLPSGMEIKRINVSGISFKVRMIWRDRSTWSYVDTDTTLTPSR